MSQPSGRLWRQGSKVGRTLYLDDVLVGVLDTPELAGKAVAALNAAGRCPCCGAWPCVCVKDASDASPATSATFFGDVRGFHIATGLVVRDRPATLPHADWSRRVRLILEELAELAEAQAAGDLEEFADGLADLAWVVLGTAVEAGIPFDEVWAEVRRANLAKVGGKLDASGKLLKPAGWSPPDVAGVLARSLGGQVLSGSGQERHSVALDGACIPSSSGVPAQAPGRDGGSGVGEPHERGGGAGHVAGREFLKGARR